VFRSLSTSEKHLVDGMRLSAGAVAPNRAIVSAGEVGVGLYLISGGWAFRYRRSGDGCRQILDFLLPGEIIGLQAALLGMSEHSVRSLTPLKLTMFDARLVSAAFRSEPALALRLARHIAAEAQRGDELATVIGCSDALQRLGFLMMNLYQRQRRRGPVDPVDCPFPLRRQHIADALGLTGAHVNRTLKRLAGAGIAVLNGHRLSILSLERLAETAGLADPTERAAPSA
jgi:CRP-like cAMP-binding protein